MQSDSSVAFRSKRHHHDCSLRQYASGRECRQTRSAQEVCLFLCCDLPYLLLPRPCVFAFRARVAEADYHPPCSEYTGE